MTKRSLFFLHIPKTGGTTLKNILSSKYPDECIYNIEGSVNECIENLQKIPKELLSKYELVQGHMSFGLHQLFPQESNYFAMMRDPLDRAISDYYFLRTNIHHHLHKQVSAMSMTSYMQSEMTSQLSNGQTRLLSGDCKDSQIGIPSIRKLEVSDLEKAKKNIRDHFSFVGLQEMFDETLLLLSKNYGWGYPFYIATNITRKRPALENISPSDKAVIQNQNRLDFALYDYVKQNFQRQLEELGLKFRIELAVFKAMNRLYRKWYGAKFRIKSILSRLSGRV
ncbi:sulfotransferase family 2 domain-containing protein [Pseudomonadota bacterium]